MSRGLIYALGVLSGGLGIAILFELLGMLDEQAPSISALRGRLGARSAAINPEAQDTVTAAVVPPRSTSLRENHTFDTTERQPGAGQAITRPGQFARGRS